MYVPSNNFSTPPDVEIICPLTGESYVYIDGEAENSTQYSGALERLPVRFHRHPVAFKQADNQLKIILPKLH